MLCSCILLHFVELAEPPMYLVWLIVKNEIMFIVIANVEFDDFVAKIKEHGPDA